MEVILLLPVHNLGDSDDVVKVKPGYARNYLIPKGMALLATNSNLRSLEEKKKQSQRKQSHLKQTALEMAEKLRELRITIETLAGADGRLFGSITTSMIANRLAEKGFEFDRRKITVDDIRTLGEFKAVLHLHKEVKAEIPVEVIKSES